MSASGPDVWLGSSCCTRGLAASWCYTVCLIQCPLWRGPRSAKRWTLPLPTRQSQISCDADGCAGSWEEAMASAKELSERLIIREIVENWALLRDARRWDRFRELWHEEGRMITIWIEGSFEEFIKASKAGYEK